MIVLGVDPGLATLGWGVIEAERGRQRLVDYGCILTTPQQSFPDRLCQMMLEAQKKAYGDGLDQTCLHPYMWLCKGHYYSGGLSFYNFPSAFGGLFARGLYAKYQQEGKDFVPLYKKMLHATSVTCVEDTAKIAGIDLTDKAFWRQGLQSLADEIDLFCQLVK